MGLGSERLTAVVRAACARTPEGARFRRRLLAVGGFALLLLGFLAAIGFARLVLLGLGAILAVAAGAVLILAVAAVGLPRLRRARPILGRARPRIPRPPIRRIAVGSGSAFGELARARPRVRRSVAGRRRQAARLNARGASERRSGNIRAAIEHHRKALEIVRELGDERGEALTLNSLALAVARGGDDDAALAHFGRSLALLRELDDEQTEGQVVANVGLVHGRRGRRQQSAECLRAALEKLSPETPDYRRVEEQLRRAS
jgi:tetratricopeptide (TPR) repeat protein